MRPEITSPIVGALYVGMAPPNIGAYVLSRTDPNVSYQILKVFRREAAAELLSQLDSEFMFAALTTEIKRNKWMLEVIQEMDHRFMVYASSRIPMDSLLFILEHISPIMASKIIANIGAELRTKVLDSLTDESRTEIKRASKQWFGYDE